MKIRRRPSPLLLLLLPAMASVVISAATEKTQAQLSKDKEAKGAKLDVSMSITQLGPKPTIVGTKDAPVDGKDGKPKIGPFVSTDKDRKKQKPESEDGELVTKKPGKSKDASAETMTIDGKPIPAEKDGGRNDPNR